jgi:hypothetical protein
VHRLVNEGLYNIKMQRYNCEKKVKNVCALSQLDKCWADFDENFRNFLTIYP